MAHLFQVGAGSGGMMVLDLLCQDPRITEVTLVEPDRFEKANVDRHLFPLSAVGRLKSEIAAEWLLERRPDLKVQTLPVDLTDPEQHQILSERAAACDLGVCAADNEPAKYRFDQLMREHLKPWTLGEVLSGGIGGWIHRFPVGGACYGCVASHLQRAGPADSVAAPPPDYSNPEGAVRETRIPAGKASISAIASLHAIITLALLQPSGVTSERTWTSFLFPLVRVPEIFEEEFRGHRIIVEKSLTCLVCSKVPVLAAGEDLDAALEQALGRLAHE